MDDTSKEKFGDKKLIGRTIKMKGGEKGIIIGLTPLHLSYATYYVKLEDGWVICQDSKDFTLLDK